MPPAVRGSLTIERPFPRSESRLQAALVDPRKNVGTAGTDRSSAARSGAAICDFRSAAGGQAYRPLSPAFRRPLSAREKTLGHLGQRDSCNRPFAGRPQARAFLRSPICFQPSRKNVGTLGTLGTG